MIRRTKTLRTTLMVLTAFFAGGCWGGPPDTLGPQNGNLAACPGTPNCVHTGLRHPSGTKGFFVRGAIGRGALMPRVAEVVGTMERTTIITANGDYLHAEARSKIFRFVDDLEIVVSPSRELIVRSASRVGRGDGGVNSARVEELRRLLTEAEILR